ncbi:MAG: S26 family signal peptidase [Candidatus Aenigmatarchaeota archaeon]
MEAYKVLVAGLVLAAAALLALGTPATSAPVSGTYLDDISCQANGCSLKFTSDVDIAKALATGSMRPTFDDDTLIIAKPVDLRVGDIVLYRRGSDLIVHRIVAIEERSEGIFYKMKGDNNLWDDGFWPESAIEWKVIGVLY